MQSEFGQEFLHSSAVTTSLRKYEKGQCSGSRKTINEQCCCFTQFELDTLKERLAGAQGRGKLFSLHVNINIRAEHYHVGERSILCRPIRSCSDNLNRINHLVVLYMGTRCIYQWTTEQSLFAIVCCDN